MLSVLQPPVANTRISVYVHCLSCIEKILRKFSFFYKKSMLYYIHNTGSKINCRIFWGNTQMFYNLTQDTCDFSHGKNAQLNYNDEEMKRMGWMYRG